MKTHFLFLFLFGLAAGSFAQNIAITDQSAYSAEGSAMLDVQSTSKGILIPRMTESERLAIASPANGLMVYQTDIEDGFYYYSSTPEKGGWVLMSSELNAIWKRDSLQKVTKLSDPDDRVGIGTNNPESKLSANGVIQSMSGGFKFPDGSVQSTASFSPGPEGAADIRWVAGLQCNSLLGDWGIQGCDHCTKVIGIHWKLYADAQAHIALEDLHFIHNVDRITPALVELNCEGQHTQEIRFNYYRYDSLAGDMVQYFRLTLTNVLVMSIDHSLLHIGNDQYAHIEKVNLLCEEMKWTFLPEGYEYTFNFATQQGGK
jgi:type VI secretion system Hcp family effector